MPEPESPETHVYGQDEAFGKIAIELLQTEKMRVLSDIDEDEVKLLSVILTIGEKIESKTLKKLAENFLQLRVSRDRVGRQELMSVALASRVKSGGKKGKQSIKDLFAGMG